MLKAIFFDMDGTLLPMDTWDFTQRYMGGVAKLAVKHGLDAEAFVKGIWVGTEAMIKNTGEKTNEAVFWEYMEKFMGKDLRYLDPEFQEFYRTDFDCVLPSIGKNEKIPQLIKDLKGKVDMYITTNPFFPREGQLSRVRWAGLNVNDFGFLTSYEDEYHCKPNPEYFVDQLKKTGLKAEEVLVVGNDAIDDACCLKAGIEIFIVTDCLLHAEKNPIDDMPHGDFDDLRNFLKEKGLDI